MKILVFGAGVIGSTLARDFYMKRKNVTILARGDHAENIKKIGLCIEEKTSYRTFAYKIPCITELLPDDEYDAIFVAVKFTQIESTIDALRANKSKNIIFVGNNVMTSTTEALLPGKNVMFAYADFCGYREEDRIVSFDLNKIVIGQRNSTSSELVDKIFARTGLKVTYEPNMEDLLLCHAARILPFVFACYKCNGKLKTLKADDNYINKLVDATNECWQAIKDSGRELLPKSVREFDSPERRKSEFGFIRVMIQSGLGLLLVSDNAMNAVDEMNALNREMKKFMDSVGADYKTWKELESEVGNYIK